MLGILSKKSAVMSKLHYLVTEWYLLKTVMQLPAISTLFLYKINSCRFSNGSRKPHSLYDILHISIKLSMKQLATILKRGKAVTTFM